MHKHSENIKQWLSFVDNRVWKQLDNQNCFTSNILEALYVYGDHIKYYDDIRYGGFVKCDIPKSIKELFLIIK